MAIMRLNERILTITSAFTRAQLKEIARESPDVLVLRNEYGDDYFAVAENANDGYISQWGVCFNKDALNSGLAQVQASIVGETDDEVKENAFKMAGMAFEHLTRVEEEIAAYQGRREACKTAFFEALSE